MTFVIADVGRMSLYCDKQRRLDLVGKQCGNMYKKPATSEVTVDHVQGFKRERVSSQESSHLEVSAMARAPKMMKSDC